MPNQRNANRLKQKGTKSLAAWDFKTKDGPKEIPMAAFDNIPRQTEIMGQPHMLSYINPQEEAMLQKMRGGLPPVAGPGGVPAFWSWSDVFGGGSTTADTSSKDDDPPSNTFSQTLANIFTPSDGASYVGGQLVDDNTGSSISAGDTSSTGNVIAGTFANDSNNDDNSYIVSSNDTLSQIAEDNNMSVAEIMDANPDITNPDQIGIGQTLDLSGAGSGSDTYADGVGLGGIGSEADTSTDASQPEITTTVLGPAPTLTDVEKILIADYGWTDNGDGTLTNPYGGIYNDGPLQEEEDYTPSSDELNASLDAAGQTNLTSDISEVDYSVTGSGQDYTTVAQSDTDSPNEFMMDQAVSDFYNQEDDTDFSLTSGDSRNDLYFDITDPSEPLMTGNGVKFTGQYEGVTYVDGYPETEPLQVTIDESTYVPGQDTFESTFQANYGVSVPTTESEFMALSDAAKADLALLPSDEKQEILKEMSLNSGEDAPFDLRVINSIASVLGVRGIGDTFEYKIVESDNLADLLPPVQDNTIEASVFTIDQMREMYGDEFVDNYLSIPGGGGGGSGSGNEALTIDEINELVNNALNADTSGGSVAGGIDDAVNEGLDASGSAFMDDAVAQYYLNNLGDEEVGAETVDLDINFGGLNNQDYSDYTDSGFVGLDLTEGGNTVGYATSGDNAGSAAIITPEGNIEIIGPGSTETGVVFTGETAVDDAIDYLTGEGEGEGEGEGGEEAIDGTGTGTEGYGSGDGEGSGSGIGDGEGSGEGEGVGSGQGDGVGSGGGGDDDQVGGGDEEPEEPEEPEPEPEPVDSYRVDNQFAVRDLVDDFNRRRKSGMGYGLPEYMRRYMSGQVIDELVRRVVLADGSEFYVTPDGRYLDPKEFIGTAVVGDPTQMKIGEEQYQTGYTTTNLRTGEVTNYDKDGNPVAV